MSGTTQTAGPSAPTVLQLENISKSFPGVRALTRVSFELGRGEVRALVGENGAGKSTLMKILSGAYSADDGIVRLFGEEIVRPSPASMIGRGVAVIYQELAQAPHLTRGGEHPAWPVAEALRSLHRLAGSPKTLARHHRPAWIRARPGALVSELSVAKRQMVEIAKAISRDARIIVLDEPSAVLADSGDRTAGQADPASQRRRRRFLHLHFAPPERGFRNQPHRHGHARRRGSRNGRDLRNGRQPTHSHDGRPRRLQRVPDAQAVHRRCRPESHQPFDARPSEECQPRAEKGEIVGVCGLAGAGRTELLRAIYGADRLSGGEVLIDNQPGQGGDRRDQRSRAASGCCRKTGRPKGFSSITAWPSTSRSPNFAKFCASVSFPTPPR